MERRISKTSHAICHSGELRSRLLYQTGQLLAVLIQLGVALEYRSISPHNRDQVIEIVIDPPRHLFGGPYAVVQQNFLSVDSTVRSEQFPLSGQLRMTRRISLRRADLATGHLESDLPQKLDRRSLVWRSIMAAVQGLK